tara:strand:+ start:196 stop:1065 length:870 start_codon:yes stop_codon:yes gene_type:complete
MVGTIIVKECTDMSLRLAMVMMWSFGCQGVDKIEDSAEESIVALSSCDQSLPLIGWSEGTALVESVQGIEEELAALDLTQLPDPVDISNLIPLYKGFVAYALEIAPETIGDSLSHADALRADKLGEIVLGALLLGQDDLIGIDFEFFRRGFYRYYTCSRGFPLTLDGFQAIYGQYLSESGSTLNSIAKCGDRRLINSASGVYIAESITDGPVRETEILLEGVRDDGQLEFLVYDADGMLTTQTQFPTLGNGPHVVTASPYVCMSCHLNRSSSEEAWGFDVLLPTTGPCE